MIFVVNKLENNNRKFSFEIYVVLQILKLSTLELDVEMTTTLSLKSKNTIIITSKPYSRTMVEENNDDHEPHNPQDEDDKEEEDADNFMWSVEENERK